MKTVNEFFMMLGGKLLLMTTQHTHGVLPICKSCKNHYPQERLAIGYKVCVNCSVEEKWSAIPVTYHKTGNTIEVVKDPQEAARITAMMARTGFGLMRGMKNSSAGSAQHHNVPEPPRKILPPATPAHSTIRGVAIARRKMPLDYEGTGLAMMSALETAGKEAAMQVVADAQAAWKILPKQAVQLQLIIETLST